MVLWQNFNTSKVSPSVFYTFHFPPSGTLSWLLISFQFNFALPQSIMLSAVNTSVDVHVQVLLLCTVTRELIVRYEFAVLQMYT